MNICIPISPSKTQYFINKAYIEYIKGAGYEPIIVSPQSNNDVIVEICDGLLIPGGIDIDPIFYGEDNVGSNGADPEKDDFERQLLWAFTGANKPVFGICRGFQLMVREFLREKPQLEDNLEYWQHINGHSLADTRNVRRTQPTHSVRCKLGNLYGEGAGDQIVDHFVNSMHHQALIALPKKEKGKKPIINMVHENLEILAYTYKGVEPKVKQLIVEAIKIDIGGGWFGVQWHPEELTDYKLLHNFFGAAGAVEEGTT